MHKVRMNSGGFNPENVKKRIAHFGEFDNGHVLRSYKKMSVAESEEQARKASIDNPENVYYVSYDDIMEPCSDLYWFQGKSYDNAGAHEALRQYRKSGTDQLNSSRKSLNSSDEQMRIIGTVTIYSDFVDFKHSVSENLLQTAVGDRAKLKFKWLGDNKVEVRAICAASDERKVKILLENSDVTKMVAWSSSANSNRKARDKVVRKVQMNSSAGCDDYVKLSTATLKRKLKNATPEEKKCIQAELNARGVYSKKSVNSAETSTVGPCFADLWTAYIDDEYACACCGKPFPAGHNSVMLDGHKPDGMHFIYRYTKDNRIGNSVNYDPYNLPPEDPEGGIFKVVVGEEADDEGYRWLNFCRNCWPELTSMSPEEIYAKYSPSVNSSKSCNSPCKPINSNRKVGNNSMRKVIFRGKLNSSRTKLEYEAYSKADLGSLEDEWGYGRGELVDLVKDGEKQIGGKFLGFSKDDEYFVFEENGKPVAYEQSHDRWFPINSARKRMNSSRKPAQKVPASKRKLNSSLVDTFLKYHEDTENYEHQRDHFDELYEKLDKYAKPGENPENMNVDELFVRATPVEQRALVALIDPSNWNEDLDSSRKLNSSEEDAASTGTEVQDTGVDGGDNVADTAELLEDALIVQNPETKEVALFVADADDEAVPEDVDVIAEVEVVADEAEVLDSSRRLKKFATAKLNSSKSCLNSDDEGEDEEPADDGTVAYDEIQLPDDTVVEVENILVVQDNDGELGLFMPEDAAEAVPEGYEVVATATPAAEADVLDSSRHMKKSNAKKLNSSVRKKSLNSGKQSLMNKVKACLRDAGLTASSVNQGTDMGSPVVNVIFRPKADWRADIDAYYKARAAYSDKYYDNSYSGGWLRDKEGYKDGPEATALNEAQAATNADAAAYEEEIKAAITPVLEAAGLDFSIRYFNECGASAPEQRYWGGSQVFLRVTDPNYQRQAKSGAAKAAGTNQSPERKLINSLQAYFEDKGFDWNDREVYRNAAAKSGNYNIVIRGLSGAPADTEEFIRNKAAELGLTVRRCVVGDSEVRIGTGRS